MRGKFTITLLNQIKDDYHHLNVLTFDERTGSSFNRKPELDFSEQGTPEFIPHSSLPFNRDNNTQYLKDSILYFRVKCEPSIQTRPWLAVNDNSTT